MVLRMAQDVLKDHLGDFPRCSVGEFQDAQGWVKDSPGWF